MLGNARHDRSRAKNVTDRRRDKRDAIWIDLEGAVGEYAFGKLVNLAADFQTTRIAIEDFSIPGGGTIDVKATRYKEGNLILPPWKVNKACDWYALMTIDWPDVEQCPTATFVGAAHRMVAFSPDNLGQLNPTKPVSHIIPQSSLLPPDEFMQLALTGRYEQDRVPVLSGS